MSFYLRKHFKVGPVRLNLSKGGLGVSGGVTGARIGLSPRGAYVHGGRHGLYYRKYAKQGRGGRGAFVGGGVGGASEGVPGGEVRYFVDTGLTYRPPEAQAERSEVSSPALPRKAGSAGMLTGFGIVLMLLGLIVPQYLLLALGGLMLAGAFVINGKHAAQRKRVEGMLRQAEQSLSEREVVMQLFERVSFEGISSGYRKWLEFRLLELLQDTFYEDPDYILPGEMEAFEERLSLSSSLIHDVKAEAFAAFLDELTEDHVVSHDEEAQLAALQKALRIPDEAIAAERHMISQLCIFRDALEAPLQPIEVSIRLKRNEECFYRCRGRLLKEKIQRQYQRQNVRYKEVAYDIDMEGDIYLCTNRILIVDRGSRSYSLNRLLDVTLSVEDHTVQLTLDDRKSPLIFTMEDVASFAGLLQRHVSKF